MKGGHFKIIVFAILLIKFLSLKLNKYSQSCFRFSFKQISLIKVDNLYKEKQRMELYLAVLVVFFTITGTTNASNIHYHHHPTLYYGGGCESYQCGVNAKCTMTDGRPVCSCLNLHMGDPLHSCYQVECIIPEDCSPHLTCSHNHFCVNPCDGFCGANANCNVVHHVPQCTCPAGYTGDPHRSCHVADPQAACKPNPCGPNTKCEVNNEIIACTCLPGYHGSPSSGCRHECESDFDCPSSLACSANFKCENPCHKCGEKAECNVVNHQAKCTCPHNWQGNPQYKCYPECTTDLECPGSKPVCLYHQCINPCHDACGVNANCELRGNLPVCSCPKSMTGDPAVRCRPFEPEDLCRPNPCGENAVCTPGHDNTGELRPVCTCPPGFVGDARHHCKRGECVTHHDCPNNRACIDYFCQNPCTGKECATNAKCEARDHIAVCTCHDGTRGDAVLGCNVIQSRISAFSRKWHGK